MAAAGLVLGAGAQSALPRMASAHDRLDESAGLAQALDGGRPAERLGDWRGVPLVEQQPATTALIETSLAALPRPVSSDRGGERRAESGIEAAGDSLRFGEVRVPRRVVEAILRAAAETGVDAAYMMALADKESRFDPQARNPASSAEGLFQFVSATWLEMIRDYGARHGLEAEAAAVTGRGAAITAAGGARARILGLRRDPYVAAVMAAELVKRDRFRVEAGIGRELSTSELYLAHFLGSASARKLLALSSETPDAIALGVFRAAARGNRSLFVAKGEAAPAQTSEAADASAQRRGGKGSVKAGGASAAKETSKDTSKEASKSVSKGSSKGVRHLTVAELHQRLDVMIDKRISRYEGVAAFAPAPEPALPAPALEPASPAATLALQMAEPVPALGVGTGRLVVTEAGTP